MYMKTKSVKKNLAHLFEIVTYRSYMCNILIIGIIMSKVSCIASIREVPNPTSYLPPRPQTSASVTSVLSRPSSWYWWCHPYACRFCVFWPLCTRLLACCTASRLGTVLCMFFPPKGCTAGFHAAQRRPQGLEPLSEGNHEDLGPSRLFPVVVVAVRCGYFFFD